MFWKKSKDKLEEYIIDILFTNGLTIIQCNQYEHQLFRDVSINTIGNIKCSNSHLFLPSNHVEQLTLLQWNYTKIKCDKKQNIINEKTYLKILHKPIKAFGKNPLKIIRVGSIGSSDVKWEDKNKLVVFQHPSRQKEQIEEIYSFKHRPILCREKSLTSKIFCTNDKQHQSFSYICYYRIGVEEPPTIADMDTEIELISNIVDINNDSVVDFYINKTPKQKPALFGTGLFIGIFVIAIIIIFIIGICIYLYCCRSKKDGEINESDSDTSIVSNTSQN